MFSHTFVVLAYKRSEHLEACLTSLLNQSERSQIVISTSTPSPWLDFIAEKYGVAIIVNSAASGIASDWNFALMAADTEYITLSHQDDVFDADYVKTLRRAALLHPDNSIIFCDYAELVDGKARKNNLNLLVKRFLLIPMYIKPALKSRRAKRHVLAWGNPVCCPSVTYHKTVIPEFRFSTDYSINLDWDAWLRIADLKGSFVYLRRILFFHRIHSQSETSSGLKDNRRQNEDKAIFARLWPTPVARFLSAIYALSYQSNNN